jgi:hypothetical protein
MFNALDEYSGIKIDFILLQPGFNPGDVFGRRVEFDVEGTLRGRG